MTAQQLDLLPSGLTKDQPRTAMAAVILRPTYAQIIATGFGHGLTADQMAMLVEAQKHDDSMAALAAYNAAVAKFQAACPVVFKGRKMGDGGGLSYMYSDFSDVMKVCKPHLDACGLSVSFTSDSTAAAGLKVTCRISHGPHHEDHTFTVPVPAMKVNDAQRFGSALSYAKRYCFCAALNVICSDDPDDDAAGLCEAISEADAKLLEKLLMDSNSNIPAFCKLFQVDKIADLPASQLGQARAAIQRKVQAAKK
jgi:hypothetical protein